MQLNITPLIRRLQLKYNSQQIMESQQILNTTPLLINQSMQDRQMPNQGFQLEQAIQIQQSKHVHTDTLMEERQPAKGKTLVLQSITAPHGNQGQSNIPKGYQPNQFQTGTAMTQGGILNHQGQQVQGN